MTRTQTKHCAFCGGKGHTAPYCRWNPRGFLQGAALGILAVAALTLFLGTIAVFTVYK